MAKKNLKTKRVYFRISEEDLKRLHKLAEKYPSVSSFIIDACWNFNAERHLNILDFIEEKVNIMNSFTAEMNKVGNNLNQLTHYTNTCIKLGIYLPNTIEEIINTQCEIKYLMNQINVDLKNTQDLMRKHIKSI